MGMFESFFPRQNMFRLSFLLLIGGFISTLAAKPCCGPWIVDRKTSVNFVKEEPIRRGHRYDFQLTSNKYLDFWTTSGAQGRISVTLYSTYGQEITKIELDLSTCNYQIRHCTSSGHINMRGQKNWPAPYGTSTNWRIEKTAHHLAVFRDASTWSHSPVVKLRYDSCGYQCYNAMRQEVASISFNWDDTATAGFFRLK